MYLYWYIHIYLLYIIYIFLIYRIYSLHLCVWVYDLQFLTHLFLLTRLGFSKTLESRTVSNAWLTPLCFYMKKEMSERRNKVLTFCPENNNKKDYSLGGLEIVSLKSIWEK